MNYLGKSLGFIQSPRMGFAELCKRCRTEGPRTFSAEVAIHFPGLDGLNKPIVWVFPDLAVCLHCGFTEFTVPERELAVLSIGKAAEGASGFAKNNNPSDE